MFEAASLHGLGDAWLVQGDDNKAEEAYTQSSERARQRGLMARQRSVSPPLLPLPLDGGDLIVPRSSGRAWRPLRRSAVLQLPSTNGGVMRWRS